MVENVSYCSSTLLLLKTVAGNSLGCNFLFRTPSGYWIGPTTTPAAFVDTFECDFFPV